MNRNQSALLTDLYQLTMLQAYFDEGMRDTAVFEFFVRALPPGRSFLLAAGLEQVLSYLEQFRVTEAELAWLRGHGGFSEPFLAALGALRFSGDVHAHAGGHGVFHQRAGAAHHCADIAGAGGRKPADQPAAFFNADRIQSRAHACSPRRESCWSTSACAARTAPRPGCSPRAPPIFAGFSGTATVQAGVEFGIPVFGTMAHSFIAGACDDEVSAFRAFARASPANVVLLIDTYDTERAARKVVLLAPDSQVKASACAACAWTAATWRRMRARCAPSSTRGGLRDATIFASGNLDE